MRFAATVFLLLTVAGCSPPPSADTFIAAPVPSAFVPLRSPNGQKQLLIARAGGRWQGHLDDTFANTSVIVAADSESGLFPEYVKPDPPDAVPIEVSSWRRISNVPAIIVDAWTATDPSLRTGGPSAIVSIVRLAGDSDAASAINASLAAELEGAVGLVSPPGETLADPSALVSRVALEAGARAVIDEDTGTVTPKARMAVLQIPVFLTDRFLCVEHFVFEDRGEGGAASTVSRFTLHDLQSGESPDMDALLGADAIEQLAAIADVVSHADSSARPVAWHPARPGVVLVYSAEPGQGARRVVVPWRTVLPLLAADSPLRAVADSVH